MIWVRERLLMGQDFLTNMVSKETLPTQPDRIMLRRERQ